MNANLSVDELLFCDSELPWLDGELTLDELLKLLIVTLDSLDREL